MEGDSHEEDGCNTSTFSVFVTLQWLPVGGLTERRSVIFTPSYFPLLLLVEPEIQTQEVCTSGEAMISLDDLLGHANREADNVFTLCGFALE